MKHVVRGGLAAVALLALVGAVGAQDRDRRDRDDDWHQGRDERYRGEQWRARMFSLIREDLDHVQNATFPIGRDQYRIQRTKQELNELQDKLGRGVYDERELDEVIGALQRVVADNRMSPRNRDALNDDLRRLREYREHHEGWGR
jgi:hypothetical protein